MGENEMESVEQMRARRAAAYQAWWEHQPVRVPRVTSWADLSITRTINWGALARFWMLDTRQFRDDQACGDGTKSVPCGEWNNPKRTFMGAAQEKWLFDGLGASRSHWQVLGNQVMVAPYDSGPGDEVRLSMDQWSGYPVARDRLLNTIAQRAANRTVVLTGDIHSNWVNELHSDFARADRPVVAAEFVATSIASGGDGAGTIGERMRTQLAENPHIKWHENRRGYIRCTVDEKQWTSEYRSVAYVTKPGAPIETPSRWRTMHGKAGIERL
jgi:alkaline phosphatase D